MTSTGMFAAILDCLAICVVVVDAEANVVFCNAAARQLFRLLPGILVRRGRLGCELAEEQRKLRDCILSSGARGKRTPACPVLALRRSSSEQSLHVLVAPLAIGTGADAGRHRAVFIIDPDRTVHPSAEMLHTLYGLSPAESRVAGVLARGCDTGTGAERLRLSEHTFRSHLKSIFHKTGTRRRSELIGLLSSGLAAVDVRAPS